MQNVRPVIGGLITALVSIGLTIGALSLSLTEGGIYTPTSIPTATLFPTNTPTWQTFTPAIITPTPLTPTLTSTLPPTSTNCPPPRGWRPYTVRSGDTLESLALLNKLTPANIAQANCLVTNNLLPGMILYVPPPPTRTPVPCGRPPAWISYLAQPGDTLYRLSQAYGITVVELQKANCITGSLIQVGQTIFVPPWAPIFPSPTYPPMITLDQVLETPVVSDTPTDTGNLTP